MLGNINLNKTNLDMEDTIVQTNQIGTPPVVPIF